VHMHPKADHSFHLNFFVDGGENGDNARVLSEITCWTWKWLLP